MDPQQRDALARLLTKTLVDLALLAVPLVGAAATRALHRFAAERRVAAWVATHDLFGRVARQAVLAVEQTLRDAPATEKKEAALARALVELRGHGLPLTAAMLTALDDAIEAEVLGGLKVIEAELRQPGIPTTPAPDPASPADAPAIDRTVEGGHDDGVDRPGRRAPQPGRGQRPGV